MLEPTDLKWKRVGYIGHKEHISFYEDGEALAWVVQRYCEFPINGTVHGQVEQDLEQPDLVKNVAVMSGMSGLGCSLKIAPKPFCDCDLYS